MIVKIFLACTGISTDRDTNTVSIFNVVEDISQTLPVVFPQLFLFALLQRETGEQDEINLLVSCTNAGTAVFENKITANFEGKQRTRLKIALQGFPIMAAGDLIFTLRRIDGFLLTNYTVEVKPLQPTPQASPA